MILSYGTKRVCLEQAPSHSQPRHNNGHHAHQFDKDIKARTGSILKRVAYRIAYNRGFMHFATFAAEIAFLDILLGIVPRTTGIRHKDSKYESAAKSADKQSQHTGNTEDKSGQDGSEGTTISRCAPFVEMATQRS